MKRVFTFMLACIMASTLIACSSSTSSESEVTATQETVVEETAVPEETVEEVDPELAQSLLQYAENYNKQNMGMANVYKLTARAEGSTVHFDYQYTDPTFTADYVNNEEYKANIFGQLEGLKSVVESEYPGSNIIVHIISYDDVEVFTFPEE